MPECGSGLPGSGVPGVCSEPERTKKLGGKFHLCQFSTAPSPVLAKKALERGEPRPASWELHQGPLCQL